MFAEVLIEYSAKSIDKTFTYIIPNKLKDILKVGMKVTGSIISTIVLLILPESLRFLADYRLIIYSLSLIIIMLTKPSGLLGRYEFSMTRLLSTIKRFFLRIINKIFKKKGDSHGK